MSGRKREYERGKGVGREPAPLHSLCLANLMYVCVERERARARERECELASERERTSENERGERALARSVWRT